MSLIFKSLLTVFFFSPPQSLAGIYPSQGDLEIVSKIEKSNLPLTTEAVWGLDPSELNPHRQRWVLKRDIQLAGLRAEPVADQQFKIAATGIHLTTTSFFRSPNAVPHSLNPSIKTSIYSPFEKFLELRCPTTPDPVFSTYEGSQLAATAAAQSWAEEVSTQKARLVRELSSIVEETAAEALEKANTFFSDWVAMVTKEWKKDGLLLAKKAEWRSYIVQAQSQGLCQLNSKKSEWPRFSEPETAPFYFQPEPFFDPKSDKSERKQFLRVPARRWEGLYSVRLSLRVGTQTLNGQFLIDSAAPKSVVSPTFMREQGLLPVFVEIQPSPFRNSIDWMTWSRGKKPSRIVKFDSVEMSSSRIPIQEFLLAEAHVYEPPKYLSTCCDGVLGNDFLSKFVVEFSAGPPDEIRVWDRTQFSPPQNLQNQLQWIEISVSENGDVVSPCHLTTTTAKTLPTQIHWHTGQDSPAQAKLTEKLKSTHLVTLNCFDQLVLKIQKSEISPVFGYPSQKISSNDLLISLTSALPFGMGDSLFLDLPHGRLGFPKTINRKRFGRPSHPGISLELKYDKDKRVLVVKELIKGNRTQALFETGLKRGMSISALDGIATNKLDAWEVEKRLSGYYGKKVLLEWHRGAGSEDPLVGHYFVEE